MQRNKKISKIRGKSISKNMLNHYKNIRMVFAESFTYTSQKLFPPLLHFWLFSTNHTGILKGHQCPYQCPFLPPKPNGHEQYKPTPLSYFIQLIYDTVLISAV